MDTLKGRLIARSVETAQSVGDHLIAALLARPPDRAKARRLLTRGRMVAQLLYDMEQDAAVEDLALRLLLAEQALAQDEQTLGERPDKMSGFVGAVTYPTKGGDTAHS